MKELDLNLSMSPTWRRLADVIGDLIVDYQGVSANCIRSLIGRDCGCWRCCGVEPSKECPQWGQAAKRIRESRRTE